MGLKSLNLKRTGLSLFLNFIRSNLYYLLTKKNLILLFIINVLSLFVIILNSSVLKGVSYLDSFRFLSDEYFETNVFQFIKFLYAIFVVFINMSYFTGDYSNYSLYFIRDYKSKILFYLSKYFAVIIFDLIEFLILFYMREFIKGLTPYYSVPFKHLTKYISLYLLGLYVLMLSSLFMIITGSHLSGLFSLAIYWLGDFITLDNTKT